MARLFDTKNLRSLLASSVIALVLGLTLLPSGAFAADGCCTIMTMNVSTDKTTTVYLQLTQEECKNRNNAFAHVTALYQEGTVAADNKSCMVANPPANLNDSTPKISNPLDNPKLAVSIPGLVLRNSVCNEKSCTTPWLGDYINGLYKYGISAIGILAVIGLMIGGLLWLTSAGNDERVGDAKKWISGSIMGLVIAFSSYMILNFVNPALTELSPIKVRYIEKDNLPDITEYQALIDNGGKVPELQTLPPGKNNIVNIQVETVGGLKSVQVDESIAELTKRTLKQVKDKGFKVVSIGGYRQAKMCHGVGLALDINSEQNYCVDCYGKKGAKVGQFYRPTGIGAGSDYTVSELSIPQDIVNIFKGNGWCWGGDWRSRKDYMHFSTPSCRGGVECGAPGLYNFNQSVKQNQERLDITYP